MKTIFIAGQNPKIIEIVKENNKVIGLCSKVPELENRFDSVCSNMGEPDILLALNDLDGRGSVPDLLIKLKNSHPLLRVIYIRGYVDLREQHNLRTMIDLIEANIYDIYHEEKLSRTIINNLIDNPKTRKDVEYFYEYKKIHQDERGSTYVVEEDIPEFINDSRDNIIAVSSCKPGSGKSFISSNLAVAIAKFGKINKSTYEVPNVLLIDADLQTLSVGTLFGNINPQYGLKTALHEISKIIDDEGTIVGSPQQIENANNHILKSCVKSAISPNLSILAGTNLTIGELQQVTPYQFYYLLDTVAQNFDIVIIDTNSSLEHVTSGVSIQLCKTCLMVITPDMNSIVINVRKRRDLKDIGMDSKVKYVINKSHKGKARDTILEGFDVIAEIPEFDYPIAWNSIYNCTPIILDKAEPDNGRGKTYDRSIFTLQTRIKLTELANKIYPVNNINDLIQECNDLKKRK